MTKKLDIFTLARNELPRSYLVRVIRAAVEQSRDSRGRPNLKRAIRAAQTIQRSEWRERKRTSHRKPRDWVWYRDRAGEYRARGWQVSTDEPFELSELPIWLSELFGTRAPREFTWVYAEWYEENDGTSGAISTRVFQPFEFFSTNDLLRQLLQSIAAAKTKSATDDAYIVFLQITSRDTWEPIPKKSRINYEQIR